MPDYARSSWALLVSFCLHAFVLSLVFTVSRASTEASQVPPRDDWVGETVEVEQLVAGPARPAGPSAPAAAAAARAENADESAGSPPSRAQEPQAPKEPSASDPEKPVVEQKVAAQSPQTASPASRAAESGKAAAASKPVGQPARAAPAKPVQDPADALARRIFGYRPKASSVSENDEAHAAASAAGGATKVGAEGEAKGVRDLARAFTRAIPAANTRDPAWNRLPLGDAGTVRVTITIRADGMLEATPHGEPRDHLERLIQRTVLALQGGRFAVSRPERGSETLVIDLTLSTRPIEEGPLMLGFEPPRRGRRGKAYFQLPTGRFVEAFVTVE